VSTPDCPTHDYHSIHKEFRIQLVSEMHIHLREGSLIWNLYVDEIPTELGKRALLGAIPRGRHPKKNAYVNQLFTAAVVLERPPLLID